ncbi:unnamed protein product [Brachionus calyciflorus]|uniref:FLYWCH-type domain-containing protein n=1 Tax=Brachionus calyciflorus TaxID=104777 RepID=A0A814HYF5_9BILA|nr:unnamed protein product [Brachionus calyciflorus]
MEKVEYLDPEKSIALFQQYKLHKVTENANGTIRWRCQQCKSISITVDSDENIIRNPTKHSKHIQNVCQK